MRTLPPARVFSREMRLILHTAAYWLMLTLRACPEASLIRRGISPLPSVPQETPGWKSFTDDEELVCCSSRVGNACRGCHPVQVMALNRDPFNLITAKAPAAISARECREHKGAG